MDDALDRRRHEHVARQGEKIIGRDSLALRKIFQRLVLLNVLVGRGHIETLRIVKTDRVVAQTDNFHARFVSQAAGGDRSDIAKALHDSGAFGRLDIEMIQGTLDEEDHAAPGRFAASGHPADGHRFSGDNFRNGMARMHRIGIHEPGHDLRVGPHVRPHDVGARADKRDHFLHVAAGKLFHFTAGKLVRVDRHPTLGSAIRKSDQRAFPTHPNGERGRFPEGQLGGKPRAAFGRTDTQVVLDAIAVVNLDPSVIEFDGQRDGDRALRLDDALTILLRDLEVIGQNLELLHGHAEDRIGGIEAFHKDTA